MRLYSEKRREFMESISFLVSILALIELMVAGIKTFKILLDPNVKIQDGELVIVQLIVWILGYWGTLEVFFFIRNMKKIKQITEVNLNSLSKSIQMHIKVYGTKKFRFRIFLASKLFLLAAWILRCRINFETTDEERNKT